MFRIVLEITAVPPYCNAITTVLQCDSHSRSNQVIVRSQTKCVSAAATAAAPLGASAAVRCPVGCAGCPSGTASSPAGNGASRLMRARDRSEQGKEPPTGSGHRRLPPGSAGPRSGSGAGLALRGLPGAALPCGTQRDPGSNGLGQRTRPGGAAPSARPPPPRFGDAETFFHVSAVSRFPLPSFKKKKSKHRTAPDPPALPPALPPAAMEEPEPAGAAPPPGLRSLLPPREFLCSRKGQLLLAESVRAGAAGKRGPRGGGSDGCGRGGGPQPPGAPCVSPGNAPVPSRDGRCEGERAHPVSRLRDPSRCRSSDCSVMVAESATDGKNRGTAPLIRGKLRD